MSSNDEILNRKIDKMLKYDDISGGNNSINFWNCIS